MSVDENGQQILLKIARDAIGHGLVHAQAPELEADDYLSSLRQIACTFVTLHMDDALRGCIGSLRAHRPLVADVSRHAYAAAFSDARFSPLQHGELAELHIHISILSALESVDFDSDDGLIACLVAVGVVDGLQIIQVHEDQAEGSTRPARASPLPFQLLVEVALIQKIGRAHV
jgi:AmmeMemoRadiSam system protein A